MTGGFFSLVTSFSFFFFFESVHVHVDISFIHTVEMRGSEWAVHLHMYVIKGSVIPC